LCALRLFGKLFEKALRLNHDVLVRSFADRIDPVVRAHSKKNPARFTRFTRFTRTSTVTVKPLGTRVAIHAYVADATWRKAA
jgi:hypothetical protein